MSESQNMVAGSNQFGERDMLTDTQEYRQLVDNISLLWDKAKEKAVLAVNSELLDANWQTGQYIVEFEQDGKTRAQYGKQLLVNLSKKEGVLAYVLIDLKRAEIRHSDIGQMNLYLNYFKAEVCQPDDNPPIGIVLGAKKDELLMEYALQGITNQLFAARYHISRNVKNYRLNLMLC